MSEEEYHGTCRWFGQAYDAPAWDGMPEVPTPVGKACIWCTEPIEEGDAGITMPYVRSATDWSIEPMHVECHIRQALGGVRHLSKECSCYGGGDHDTGMSAREESRLVMLGWGPKPL